MPAPLDFTFDDGSVLCYTTRTIHTGLQGIHMYWSERQSRIRADLAGAFSARSGISREDFLEIFYDAEPPPPIGDFTAQYIADEAALEQILSHIAELTGLKDADVKGHYHAGESFPQFAEHLLRAGAYR